MKLNISFRFEKILKIIFGLWRTANMDSALLLLKEKILIFGPAYIVIKRITKQAKNKFGKCLNKLKIFRLHASSHSENNGIDVINQTLQTQMTKFILSDAQSFRVVENSYFKEMVRTLIDVGWVFNFLYTIWFRRQCEKHSLLNEALVIPNEYKIADEIDKQYKDMRNLFLHTHQEKAIKNGFACTFDFSQAGPDYGVLTLHYIDDNW